MSRKPPWPTQYSTIQAAPAKKTVATKEHCSAVHRNENNRFLSNSQTREITIPPNQPLNTLESDLQLKVKNPRSNSGSLAPT